MGKHITISTSIRATKTIRRAMHYRSSMPDLWRRAQINGMTRDWSWDARAVEYEEIYESVVVE